MPILPTCAALTRQPLSSGSSPGGRREATGASYPSPDRPDPLDIARAGNHLLALVDARRFDVAPHGVQWRLRLRVARESGARAPKGNSRVIAIAILGVCEASVRQVLVRRDEAMVFRIESLSEPGGGTVTAGEMIAAMAWYHGVVGIWVPLGNVEPSLSLASTSLEIGLGKMTPSTIANLSASATTA